jgi:hypothetical protein
VVIEDGELVEFASRSTVAEIPAQERRIFYAEFIAADRSYKNGWAAMKYKERFGHFPPWSWNDDITATPTVTTLNWVRSRQIAFAKARESA